MHHKKLDGLVSFSIITIKRIVFEFRLFTIFKVKHRHYKQLSQYYSLFNDYHKYVYLQLCL